MPFQKNIKSILELLILNRLHQIKDWRDIISGYGIILCNSNENNIYRNIFLRICLAKE